MRRGMVTREDVQLLTSNTSKRSSWKKTCYITVIVLMSIVLVFTLLAAIAGVTTWILITRRYPYKGDELHWDWRKIDLNDIHFPSDFLWGTTSSAHQIEGGCDNNQWYLWEKKRDPDTGKSPIKDQSVSGNAADFWNRYKEDIARMKNELFVNTFRFSIEWSKIEKSKGVINAEAVKHYHDVLDELKKNDIKPIVTLHHLTNPIWFENYGGWLNETNIEHYLDYCRFAFNEYSSKVHMWITIDVPNAVSIESYEQGVWPPGYKDTSKAANAMKNLAIAHLKAYHMLKALPKGNSTQIGMVLNVLQFDPANSTNPLDRMISGMITNDFIGGYLGFFKNGVFVFSEPGTINIRYEDKSAIGALDFIGINYFGNTYVKFKATSPHRYEEVNAGKDPLSDQGWPIYPEGIYRAIVDLSELNKPILIAENGVPDVNDKYRDVFVRKYLYAVSKAIKEGHNVIGYMYYSMLDNFSWEYGYSMKYGLYEVDFSTQQRRLRKGSKTFVQLVRKARNL